MAQIAEVVIKGVVTAQRIVPTDIADVVELTIDGYSEDPSSPTVYANSTVIIPKTMAGAYFVGCSAVITLTREV